MEGALARRDGVRKAGVPSGESGSPSLVYGASDGGFDQALWLDIGVDTLIGAALFMELLADILPSVVQVGLCTRMRVVPGISSKVFSSVSSSVSLLNLTSMTTVHFLDFNRRSYLCIGSCSGPLPYESAFAGAR